ncbi:MAG: N-acetyl-gamma-glutamyl-phosphate reductase [Clostridia bacterium]|nr:N-acetyl-gamma-glutamyl-phosphate reductase [Clostridia bacterium]
MVKTKVGIVGVTGYAGAELLRILITHPYVKIGAISSVSFEDSLISDVYPAFYGFCDKVCKNQDKVIEKSDVIFAALPAGLSQELAYKCNQEDKIFIDLGADFRLSNEEDYKEWYGGEYENKNLHRQSAYGLPELFRSEIRGKKIIGNPGCYPTSIALALAPAMKARYIKSSGIIIDSKSGTTGAGRGTTQTTHFPECNENFAAYKIAAHRHTPEIEQTLSIAYGSSVKVTFVPHLLPVNRGILSTCYAPLAAGIGEHEVRSLYERVYGNEYFVRLLPEGSVANIKNVKYSNFCDISIHTDERTGTLIICSAIDNMVKGAAGQAVQNMNILLGLPETTGLEFVPPSF